MTLREKEILEMIKKNPLISQQEIAERLEIARSSVAVHITNLMKKGYITGKGYIVSEKEYIAVVGGANMDIQGFTKASLIPKDSNPGKVKLSLGGVGRNIAENLTKLGIDAKLITALGDDLYGEKILEESRMSGIDMDHCIQFKGTSTSTYLSILNDTGDMEVAVSDMDIFDKLSFDLIRDKLHVVQNAKAIVLDTNLPEEILTYLVQHVKEKKLFLDPVSTTKAKRVKNIIGSFHTIKPNRLEAEILSDMKITNASDLNKAAAFFLSQGVEKVFISLGKEGIFYADAAHSGCLPEIPIKVVNATGAGDAFMAGLIFGDFNQYNIKEQAQFAMAAAVMALSHENTINPMLSLENIENVIKEMKKYV
ncbi:MAG: PfkB family carbohydrate kinase [Bacillota bacterium]